MLRAHLIDTNIALFIAPDIINNVNVVCQVTHKKSSEKLALVSMRHRVARADYDKSVGHLHA